MARPCSNAIYVLIFYLLTYNIVLEVLTDCKPLALSPVGE